MGICYNIILHDSMDWNSHWEDKSSKDKQLESFTKEYKEAGAYCCEKVAEWYGYAVFDVDKRGPYDSIRKAIVRKYSDVAYFTQDNMLGSIQILDD